MKVKMYTAAYHFRDGFPLVVWPKANHPASQWLHRHEFHELVLITQGCGRHLTNNGAHPISAGDVFLLHGKLYHGYADVDHLSLINILFRPRQLGLPLHDLGGLPGYQRLFHIEPRLRQQQRTPDRLHLTSGELAEAVRLVTELEQELRQHVPGYRFAARSHLMRLITHLTRCRSQTTAARGVSRLGEVLSYLDRHYREPITIAQLLPIARMSETGLIRAFHRVFQHSPIDYLIRLRVQKACELLADSELRITEIALACGFNDSNYFARQFRRIMGRSARDHRHRLQQVAPVTTA